MSTRRERREVYDTGRWRALRAAVLLRAGHQCARCRKAGRRVLATLVHHVVPIRQGGDPWEAENLEPLCRRCHDETHDDLEDRDIARAAWGRYLERLMEEAG